jgi:glyoxylase-like metal-dependent hydrolase (beta-lactamase superfamily II)
MFNNESAHFTINNVHVKIHAISTGMVSVKTKYRDNSQSGLLAKLDFVVDQKFTEWMPIWVWVVEHPEGIFLIDTGENANVNDADYFRSSGWFANWAYKSLFRFDVKREDEIDIQLQKLGIRPKDLKAVLITHLHLDHTDGIRHFPDTRICVHKNEWKKPSANLPKLYPTWFKPELIELPYQYEEFDQACYLTTSKDFIAIFTPGHTNGHISFLLKTDQGNFLFAGDICDYQEQLLGNHFAPANVSLAKSKDTYRKVKSLAKRSRLVFLPSHDCQSAERLKNLDFLFSDPA